MLAKKHIFFTFILATIFMSTLVQAKTVFVGPNETYKTIKSGISAMSGGDTLIIKDGVYTGIDNMISTSNWAFTKIPNGASGKYTTIKAENDFGVIIDGQGKYRPVHIENASYIQFQGLHVRNCESNNGGSNFRAEYSRNIKVINCASEEAYYGSFWFRYCKYVLAEGCFVWGRQTYAFAFVGSYNNYKDSQYNIVRRCVVRRDAHYYADGGNHYSAFVSYWGDHTYFQNCISIDGIHNPVGSKDPFPTMAVFYTANGSSNYNAVGCVSINDEGSIALFESAASPVNLKNNIVMLNSNGPYGSEYGVLTYGNAITIENNTFANATGSASWSGNGIGEVSGKLASVKNNIIYGSRNGLEGVSGNHSYNVLYNDLNYQSTKEGGGETTDLDPLTSGLLYPVRVEAGSKLAEAGQAGARVGAQVLKKIGVSGTVYGQTGWNAQTSEALWPFPNEDIIRSKMRSYNRHKVNAERGFCAPNQTLTKYIWEYLGNTIADDIYGSGENKALVVQAGSDQSVTDTDGDGVEQVSLSGSAVADADGSSLSYVWKENGHEIASGMNATPTLDVGSHTITLEVTDEQGGQGRDTVVVVVRKESEKGDSSSFKINFQPPGSQVPAGYLPDEGAVYSQSRGYGWSTDISSQSRNRDINSDQRLDTFLFADDSRATWEIDLPNGQYAVSLSVGDPDAPRGDHLVVIEDNEYIRASTQANRFIELDEEIITVSNKKLTLLIGGGAPNEDEWGLTNLNYIIIESIQGVVLKSPTGLGAVK